jgi:hypothetical protein
LVIADSVSKLKDATVAGAVRTKKKAVIAKSPEFKPTKDITVLTVPEKTENVKIVPISIESSPPSKAITKPVIKKTIDEPSQIAMPSTYVEDEISKAEILAALDSLAKLKLEQERIVEYLTKRINKKPIDVMVSSDSVTIEIYDNAIHDKDSVSIIFNNRIIVDKQELKVNKPIRFTLKVDKNKKFNEMILVAENLGAEPPNTAVMFVTEKNGRRQQVLLSTDMSHNEVVYCIRIGKE